MSKGSGLLVMKFGGTSMGSAERIEAAARLTTEQKAKRPVAIVVSAMSKVTDLLLDSLQKAEAGDEAGLDANLAILTERHATCCQALLPAGFQETAIEGVGGLIGEFARIAKGILMLGERPLASVDRAVAIGERLSALLIAAYLESKNTRAAAVNAVQVIATDDVFGNASPLMEETRERAANVVKPLIDQGVIPVVTGLQCCDHRRTSDHPGTWRLGFLGSHLGGSDGCRGVVDLDRRRWHHDRRSATDPGCAGAGRDHL